jgi:hypothetical protein
MNRLDVHELLQVAKADPPPMRRSVDDVLAAGRRRRRRGRIAWGSGTSAVLVAAAAAAVAVPRVVADRREEPPPAAVAAPANVPSSSAGATVTPGPTAAPSPAKSAPWLAYGFRGYTAGQFVVSSPILVTPGYQEAFVRKGNELDHLYDASGAIVASTPATSAMLTIYRPGVFNPARFARGEPVKVRGRPGYFGADVPYHASEGPRPRPALAWRYADDAWAVVSNLTPTVYSRSDLIRVAEGLAMDGEYPATVAFKASWLPPDYRLTSAGSTDDYPQGGSYMVSSVRLITALPSYRGLTEPVNAEKSGQSTVRIAIYPLSWTDASHRRPGTSTAYCNAGNASLCYRMTPDGKYLAEAVGSGGQKPVDLKKILDGLAFASIEDPSSWYPLTIALPVGPI